MKKRIYSLVLCLAVLFSLAGCKAETPAQASGFPQVTTQTDPSTGCTETTGHTDPSTGSTETTGHTDPTEPAETTLPAIEPPPEVVEPVNVWTPICNEFINLRSEPDGNTVIAQVPVGAELILEKWCGKYALVTYGDQRGYVASNYLKPVDEDYFTQRLPVVAPSDRYTVDQMWADMGALQSKYPQLAMVSVIGLSEEGRKIPVLQIGSPDAPKHVLMQGAIHGREYMTAWLLMAIADYALSQDHFSDTDICYHIIPMSNPDGVVISQTMTLNEAQKAIYQSDKNLDYTSCDPSVYAQQWKANALGVDLNRNFSPGWEVSLEHTAPSSEKYRGDAPFSAAESIALRDYTLRYNFGATVSVHSHGSVIYYQYGKKQPVNDLSYDFALAIEKVTGYTPLGYDGTTGAGYKDWAMDTLGIPSLTLEIGTWYTPMPKQELYNTFARCENLIPTISQWLTDTL